MSDRKLDKGFVRATTPDPLSLDGLIAWLETMPADGEYDWANIRGCLGFQYLTAVGLPVDCCSGDYWIDAHGRDHALPWLPDIAGLVPWTFGAALQRARALRESV